MVLELLMGSFKKKITINGNSLYLTNRYFFLQICYTKNVNYEHFLCFANIDNLLVQILTQIFRPVEACLNSFMSCDTAQGILLVSNR